MILEMSEMSKLQAYHTLTQVVVPRPVAWVLSENGTGDYNLAPFSFFSVVCSDPPVIMISVGAAKPDGSEKDTYRNIIGQEKFVIHIAGSDLANEVTQSSASLPHGQSEIAHCGLELVEVEGFALPRVKGPKIALACSLYQHQEVGNSNQHLIFGEIEKVWVDESAVTEDEKGRMKIDAASVDPLGRLGGTEYQTFGEVISIPRPA
ncbi:flavin reductase family protein [uncultured Neptuniibacter sp.]|uniref:flavin reductase family protein n=1 Tax=uncultured Neptuniibacter sp. TaxID=502143 RepID=UPI0026286848|nr:flavin reductase family protein [uncultured Neptuniibacter sp.]